MLLHIVTYFKVDGAIIVCECQKADNAGTCYLPPSECQSEIESRMKMEEKKRFCIFLVFHSYQSYFSFSFLFFFVVYVQVGISTLSFLKGRGGIHRPEIISAKHHTMYIHSFHRHIMSVYIRIITKLLSVRSCHNPELDRQTIDFVNFKIQARLSKIYLIASSEDVCLY